MKIIESSATLIQESNPLKKVELAGRTCYKSEKNITDESAVAFVKNLVSRQHSAMLEHAVFTFLIDAEVFTDADTGEQFPFFTVDALWRDSNQYAVTANLRAIHENDHVLASACKCILHNYHPEVYEVMGWSDTGKEDLGKVVDPETLPESIISRHLHISFRFICDRGVTHELVRHRPSAFGQESTRYVAYEKNDDMLFIEPSTWNDMPEEAKDIIKAHFERTEEDYRKLRSLGLQAQQARAILDTGIKSEIVMTASVREWEHVFALRRFGVTGPPHPDMKLLMDQAYPKYEERLNQNHKAV